MTYTDMAAIKVVLDNKKIKDKIVGYYIYLKTTINCRKDKLQLKSIINTKIIK